MMFWLIGGALTALTMLSLLFPVFRSRKSTPAGEMAQAVFVDQLSEVDRDEARGIISGDEAASARTEVKRRMLSEAKREDLQQLPSEKKGGWLLLAVALAAPALGTAGYTFLGSPQLPSISSAERQGERDEAIKIAELTAQLKNQLISDENSPAEGWIMLGQTYMRAARYSEATWAFETLIKRGEISPAIFAMYAESMIADEDGIVTPKAAAAIEESLKLDPYNVAAIYYKSMELDQVGETRAAFDLLRNRIEFEDNFQPWMETVAARANWLAGKIGGEEASLRIDIPAAPGPSAEDVAAAGEMSEEDRQAFIRSMVERLAAQLEESPDDLDGWLRLARAYSVLGESENANAAYTQANRLATTLPQGDPRLKIIADGLVAE